MRRLVLFSALTLHGLPAAAQTRGMGVSLAAGTGLELGNGGGDEALTARSPLFIDVAARTWTDEEPRWSWGGSLRIEVEGRASVAIVPRVDLERQLGPVTLRPSAGLPLFFAPFTMFGLEAGVTGRLPIGGKLGVLATLQADAFVIGSDVPRDSAVLMFNGLIGVELGI
ncbi:MAG: hypothetical protein HYY06_23540 [Deltaproteobacteria bacterium]|nr:hypothetical protein [Deltaproteobacteria bacterium]